MNEKIGDVQISDLGGFVALCEIQRGPNNFFDVDLIRAIADSFDALDADDNCRAIVLASQGKHFCAGANFGSQSDAQQRASRTQGAPNPLYVEAVRLFGNKKPVVAAIQGAAVGGGFGLAMMADFRVGCPQARFTANFVKLGFTPGFGLTHVLPRVVGQQVAQNIFLTGRRIGGEEAALLGIIDTLVEQQAVRDSALALAGQIAENAPLAVMSVRSTLRGDLASAVKAATDQEGIDQFRLQQTNDHKEGVKAVAERRAGRFTGT